MLISALGRHDPAWLMWSWQLQALGDRGRCCFFGESSDKSFMGMAVAAPWCFSSFLPPLLLSLIPASWIPGKPHAHTCAYKSVLHLFPCARWGWPVSPCCRSSVGEPFHYPLCFILLTIHLETSCLWAHLPHTLGSILLFFALMHLCRIDWGDCISPSVSRR